MAVGLQIKVGADVTGLMGAFQAAAGGAGSLTDTLKATVSSMSPIGAAGVAAADALIGMTTAAAEDRTEQEKLNAVYLAAGAATGEYSTKIQEAIDLGADKAYSDSEVRGALEGLVTATGDAAEANELLGPAMDIARLAGVDLSVAADALAKASSGAGDAALRKLVPGLEKGATAADTIREATELASGQADIYATSAEGMGKKGSDAFGELGEQIGSVFLPILDEVMPLMGPIVEIIGELITAVLPPVKPAIKIVVEALKIFIEVLKTLIGFIKDVIGFISDLVTKAQDAANFVGSIDLNPFSAPGGDGGGGAYPETAARSRRGRAAGGGANQGNMTVNVYGGDPHAIERAVARGFRGWAGISGKSAHLREY